MTGSIQPSFDAVLKPINQATGLPNRTYVEHGFINIERDQVLGKNWAGIAFVCDLPNAGYVKPVEFLGLPLLITRSKTDEIKVFHNVCSHRGRVLVEEEGANPGLIRCPYHAWSYDFSGTLRATPHIGGVDQHECEGFDRNRHGLKPVRSETWMGVVFVNLSEDAPDFADYIAPLTQRWQPYLGHSGLDMLRYCGDEDSALTVEVDCNWKLAVENYCESYHLPFVHPGLNTYSRLEDHYHIMIDDRFGGQGSWSYNTSEQEGISLPRFAEWEEDRLKEAEYVSFYPNVLLGIQVDHVFVMIVEPISETKTIEHLRLFYVGDESTTNLYAASRKANLAFWREVFNEDITAVEGMQRGRQSPGYQGGVFSPVMDNPTHHFHQWVAHQLGA